MGAEIGQFPRCFRGQKAGKTDRASLMSRSELCAIVELRHQKSIIKTMHDIPNRIADVLLEVEATLRTNGKWDEKSPASSALMSTQPFCLDTLEFEQWLQWIFLPRMKNTLEEMKPLPAKSSIFVYAEECLQKNDPSTGNLLKLIKKFDDLIKIQSSARLH